MLEVIVEAEEFFNEDTAEFTSVPSVTLTLEHSLVSMSKWESKFKKPFLGPGEKTLEETMGYIESMVTSNNVDSSILNRMNGAHFAQINNYIASTESATTFNTQEKGRGNAEVITSELVYYWMISFNIPFECETWHLNRLFSLIQICNLKNSNPKKMPKNEIAARNRALNEQRKAQLNTRG
jgi:hypothetical protein